MSKRENKGGLAQSPKGLLQVLWEQGCIDEKKWKGCTKKGSKDSCGNLIKSNSLDYSISIQKDLLKEKTIL